ncbi:MAG: hypothetical protein FJW23_08040 [Acidimicrobiia bacterium]|nr:hypothetical protein [Acidimicrobiia bacterium]
MSRLRTLGSRLRAFFRHATHEQDLREEIDAHLDLLADEHVRQGEEPEAARTHARRTFGGVEQVKERYRDQRHLPVVEALLRDLRFAARALLRTSAFTVTVVVVLALGSGANTAVFSMFQQTVWQALPVPAPGQLVNLRSPGVRPGRVPTGGDFGADATFSYPLFRDLEREQQVFTGVAAHRNFLANVVARGTASQESGWLVSGSYFPVLGLAPAHGRLLRPDDDRTVHAGDAVVLSWRGWHRLFNGDPAAINATLTVNGHPMTIVGVAPATLHGTTLDEEPLVYAPLSMAAALMPDLRCPGTAPERGRAAHHALVVVGRDRRRAADRLRQRRQSVADPGGRRGDDGHRPPAVRPSIRHQPHGRGVRPSDRDQHEHGVLQDRAGLLPHARHPAPRGSRVPPAAWRCSVGWSAGSRGAWWAAWRGRRCTTSAGRSPRCSGLRVSSW